MVRVVIIDYGSGNLRSAAKAFAFALAASGADGDIVVSGDSASLGSASHIVLPGVGAFADCKAGLEAVPGLRDALEAAVIGQGKPFLGICVGMQLMADVGLEHGRHDGFGWIAGEVRALEPADKSLKVPHMGWNDLEILAAHPVLDGIESGRHAYFVHSYGFKPAADSCVLASADYGGPVGAVIGRDNMIGTQFHPEKSQRTGLRLIANFLAWKP